MNQDGPSSTRSGRQGGKEAPAPTARRSANFARDGRAHQRFPPSSRRSDGPAGVPPPDAEPDDVRAGPEALVADTEQNERCLETAACKALQRLRKMNDRGGA